MNFELEAQLLYGQLDRMYDDQLDDDSELQFEDIVEALPDMKKDVEAGFRELARKCDAEQLAELTQLQDAARQKLRVLSRVIRKPKPATTTAELNESFSAQCNVKCPPVSIPEFDGRPEKWIQFRDVFEAVVHQNPKLAPIIKFTYLTNAMKIPENKENVLKAHTFSADNYEAAWKAVKEHYDDRRRITSELFSKLTKEEPMKERSAAELQRVLGVFSSQLNALEQLGYKLSKEDDFANAIVTFLAVEKLEKETVRDWRLQMTSDSATWEELREFLQKQWRSLDGIEKEKTATVIQPKRPVSKSATAIESSMKSTAEMKAKCVFCSEGHRSGNCPMNVAGKKKVLFEKRLCLNCLRSGHMANDCDSRYRCMKCNKKHHTSIHDDQAFQRPAPTSDPKMNPTVEPFKPFPSNVTTNAAQELSMSTSGGRATLLTTAIVEIEDTEGCVHRCRALIDQGSDNHSMTTKLVEKLKLKKKPKDGILKGITGKPTVIRHTVSTKVHSLYGPFVNEMTFNVLDKLMDEMPREDYNTSDIDVPKSVFLADPKFHKSAEIDILIGGDVFYKAVLEKKIELKSGLILLHSKFGWLVGGTLPYRQSEKAETLLSCFTMNAFTGLEELDAKIEKFLENEEVITSKRVLSPEEQHAEDHFSKTTSKSPEGRFVVRLPFKENHEKLGINYGSALRQSYCQESKRSKDESYNQMYVSAIEDFVSSKHVERVTKEDIRYFVPHHGVLKLSSESTKMRPVFNASCKSESGYSLNDFLCVGPTIQPESYDLLLRFREHKYTIMGDITKMYRQIEVHEDDRKYLGFFWRKDVTKPIEVFQHNRVTFGTACAPFQATRCLKELANEQRDNFPSAAAILENSFYMDDLLAGSDSIEEGSKVLLEIRYILSRAGFHLSKIASNAKEILHDIHPADLKIPTEKPSANDLRRDDEKDVRVVHPESCTSSKTTKALGIGYDVERDEFYYDMEMPRWDVEYTKAGVLSVIAGLFDPMGWFGPFIFQLKLFMKEMWKDKIDWKEKLSEKRLEQWRELLRSFTALKEIRIPRYCFVKDAVNVELHGFCDASMSGYGAVIFAASIDESDNITIRNLTGKSKVAPNKPMTLARLELQGAVLLGMLIERVVGTMKRPFNDVTLWCDSMIVLHWIKLDPSKLSVFVGNRVADIQKRTSNFKWKHIAGKENPADLISRGISAEELNDADLWWNGPPFLRLPRSEWPESRIVINEDDDTLLKEVRKTQTTLSMTEETNKMIIPQLDERKNCRIASWTRRSYKDRDRQNKERRGQPPRQISGVAAIPAVGRGCSRNANLN